MKIIEENISKTSLIRFLILIIVFATLSFLVILVFYISNFGNGLSSDQSVWGAFGDFLGGTLNPILSFLSLLALLFTIVLQNTELQATREELKLSRKAQEEQTKSFQAQLRLLKQKEKRDLTFQMLERWTNSTMRNHRSKSWDYLIAEFGRDNFTINMDKFRNDEKEFFMSFSEVCHFLSDLNKIFNEDLIDNELAIILFNDSVSPWFVYTDNLDFESSSTESKPSNYSKNVENWYRSHVMSLKEHFENRK